MRKGSRLFAALSISLAVITSAQSQATVKDASGSTITVMKPVTRIVSLSPAITEILYASGAGNAVVGVTQFCNYPEDAAKKPRVAGFGPETVNMEAIVALAPEIVLGDESVHKRLAGQFANARVTLVLLALADFDDVFEAMLTAGALAGTGPVATAAVAGLKKRAGAVDSAVLKIPLAQKPVVFWEVWDEPLMTAGPGTFIDILISRAGGRNAFSDVKEAWPMVSFEQIVARNPDVIMSPMTHGDKMTAENLSKRPLWSGLKAVKNGRIHLLPDDPVSRPGPRMVDALELMAKLLKPGAGSVK